MNTITLTLFFLFGINTIMNWLEKPETKLTDKRFIVGAICVIFALAGMTFITFINK